MDKNTDRIIPLDDMDDFKVADEDPDVRGWDVMTADGSKLGEVDNLLVDSTAKKVRYLDVDLDDGLLDDDERHILIPIGYARLHENDDQVFVDGLQTARVGDVPGWDHGALTRDYETSLHSHFGGSATARDDDDFYANEAYDETRFYGSRRRT